MQLLKNKKSKQIDQFNPSTARGNQKGYSQKIKSNLTKFRM